jgi:cell division protein FtsN
MKTIVALAVGVALIALGALVFSTLRPQQTAQTVPLQPIEATPQRVATPPEPAPAAAQSPATVKATTPLEPRPETFTPPPAPTPEPGERPADPATSTATATTTPNDTTPPAATTKPPAPTSLPVRQTAQGWGVQAGAFKTGTNANALRDRLLKAGLAARVEAGEGSIYRVIVGAYSTADAARASGTTVLAALK